MPTDPALISAAGSDTITHPMMREAVVTRMTALGWNLNRLSRESGVSYGRLYEWVNGTSDSIRSDSLEAVFIALGLSVKVPPAPKSSPAPKPAPRPRREKP